MGFKAVDTVEVLDYDFTPWGGSGVTPEPSDAQIKAFQKALRSIIGPALVERQRAVEAVETTPSAAEMEALLARGEDNEADEQFDALLTAVAAVCSHKPTKAEIKKLPYRVKRHFCGYIAGTFLGEDKRPLRTANGRALSPEEWYAAARYFSMTPDQWDALPWFQTRALIEGLVNEGEVTRHGAPDSPAAAIDLTSADVADYATLGLPAEEAFVGA